MADDDQQDFESSPGTAAFVPDFDTGEHSAPLQSPASETSTETADEKPDELPDLPATTAAKADATDDVTLPPAHSVTVPGRYFYLKWWKLVLVVAGVWIIAAVIGLGLFSWWHDALHKTPADFAVLVYVLVCTVGGLMLAMVPDKPLLSALAIAVLSAVFASLAAAAPLYGHYFCEQAKHCLVGLVPY